MCVVRNLVRNGAIVYGGGSAEIACAVEVNEHANKRDDLSAYAFRGFAAALESVPLALAENSGLAPIKTLADARSRQKAEKNPFIGIDCMCEGESDMKKQGVFETLIGKQQQLLLATQVVKMILKIDDVMKPNEAMRQMQGMQG